jgi:enoyl-CoA hydratase
MALAHDYEHLEFERHPHGVLLITINRPDQYNAANERLHRELGRVWLDVADDPDASVAVITGKGRAFSAGGDLAMVRRQIGDGAAIRETAKEVVDLVVNIVNCEKPVISAINGPAAGSGLAVALMADISIAAENAKLTDGHLRLGVAAGDHAVLIWPLLCGLAKAKYYLMTCETLDGREAERIGLVSRCVPQEQVLSVALDVAQVLATGPQQALRWTKRSLNHWLRDNSGNFEAAAAYEMLGFLDEDVKEGLAALEERRAPRFPSVLP